jgi:hypothetical protein
MIQRVGWLDLSSMTEWTSPVTLFFGGDADPSGSASRLLD